MFPALRKNGLARWLALVLALFGLAAILLLAVAHALGGNREGGNATVVSVQPASAPAQPLASEATEPPGSQREAARVDAVPVAAERAR